MYRTLVALLLIVMHVCPAMGQILPQEGNMLNYRLIGFSFAGEKTNGKCKLEIADGNYEDEKNFRKHIIKTYTCQDNRMIGEVPGWGAQYTWRIVNLSDKRHKGNTVLHHFSTVLNLDMDTANMRLKILHPAEICKDAFVLLDYPKAMYDMKGNALWFLPAKVTSKNDVRDLKVTSRGTFTVLVGDKAYEIDYNGKVLWEGPDNGAVNGENKEHYHHELTRLSNGHYMVMGDENLLWKSRKEDSLIAKGEAKAVNVPERDNIKVNATKSPLPTIIEYDEKGKVVWSWKSSVYFKESDIYFHPA